MFEDPYGILKLTAYQRTGSIKRKQLKKPLLYSMLNLLVFFSKEDPLDYIYECFWQYKLMGVYS